MKAPNFDIFIYGKKSLYELFKKSGFFDEENLTFYQDELDEKTGVCCPFCTPKLFFLDYKSYYSLPKYVENITLIDKHIKSLLKDAREIALPGKLIVYAKRGIINKKMLRKIKTNKNTVLIHKREFIFTAVLKALYSMLYEYYDFDIDSHEISIGKLFEKLERSPDRLIYIGSEGKFILSEKFKKFIDNQ